LLLGHLDGVESASTHVEGEAPELAQGIADAIKQPGVLLDQEPRSVIAASLLVAQDEQ